MDYIKALIQEVRVNITRPVQDLTYKVGLQFEKRMLCWCLFHMQGGL